MSTDRVIYKQKVVWDPRRKRRYIYIRYLAMRDEKIGRMEIRAGAKTAYRQECKADPPSAQNAEAELRQRVARYMETGTPYLPEERPAEAKPKLVTFASVWSGSFASSAMAQFRPSTRETYSSQWKLHLEPLWGAREIASITKQDWTKLDSDLAARGVKPRACLNMAKSIVRCAGDQGDIGETDMQLVQLRAKGLVKSSGKRLHTYSEAQYEKLLGAAEGMLGRAILLAGDQALRISECRALEVRDFVFDATPEAPHGVILVRRTLSGVEGKEYAPKGREEGNEDEVPMTARVSAEAKEWCQGQFGKTRILQTKNGTTPRRNQILTALYRLQKRIGMEQMGFHLLRHTAIAEVARSTDLKTVMKFARHTSAEMSLRYMKTDLKRVSDAMEQRESKRQAKPA